MHMFSFLLAWPLLESLLQACIATSEGASRQRGPHFAVLPASGSSNLSAAHMPLLESSFSPCWQCISKVQYPSHTVMDALSVHLPLAHSNQACKHQQMPFPNLLLKYTIQSQIACSIGTGFILQEELRRSTNILPASSHTSTVTVSMCFMLGT